MITPKLAESVQRSLRLKELFHQRRYSENSMWGTISLAELLKALEAESIDLNDIKLTFSENVLDAITLPSGGVTELTLDSEDKSLLNDHWFYTDVLDECIAFEECGRKTDIMVLRSDTTWINVLRTVARRSRTSGALSLKGSVRVT